MIECTDVPELVKYLESGDLDVVSEIKQVVFENLHASKDASFLNALFESYLNTKSDNLLEILAGINESHCQYLFDKMNELLKNGMCSEITALFAAIINRQPPWLYKIVGSMFFSQYLKILKSETDVVFVMSGAVIIAMLLPCVPSLVAPYLGDILELFVRMTSFIVNKPGSLPDVLILHLQIGVYILFQRLYSMYPNNFLSYMRSYFGSSPDDPVFYHVIQPLLQFVKFHPGLILDTLKSETETSKWKTSQPHDIYAECQKISLDPLDAMKEATYTVFSSSSLAQDDIYPKQSVVVGTSLTTPSAVFAGKSSMIEKEMKVEDKGHSWSVNDEGVSYLASQSFSLQWSPSFLCGLSTPPSSRPLSRVNSTQDIISMDEFVQRPMTPVHAFENKDLLHFSDDTHTSTPIMSRRLSGGDLKQQIPQSFVAAALNLKSKSADSVEAAVSTTSTKGANLLSYKRTNSTPPKKRNDVSLEKQLDMKQQSPRLSKSERSVKVAESVSAPSTPMVMSKNHLPFLYTQQSTTANTSLSDATRSSTQKLFLSKNDLSLNEMSVSLLKVIQDLHQDVISKQNSHGKGFEYLVDEAEQPQHLNVKSPCELLDEFLSFGSSLHSLQLSRIPLTSQMNTDWTYFGGFTPADELLILRAQVNLFAVQLQYERQKCNQHVFRNRRLVGKVHKAQALEDELAAMKEKVSLLNAEFCEATIVIKRKDNEIKKLRESKDALEKEKTKSLRFYSDENQKLKYKIEELSAQLSGKDSERSTTEKELQHLQAELFNMKSELDAIKPRLEINNTVQTRAEQLSKELVALQDKYNNMKRSFQNFDNDLTGHYQQVIAIDALKNEVRDLKAVTEDLNTTLDAAKLKITDLEAALSKKELTIRDQKNNMEFLCSKHNQDVKERESGQENAD
eukprot:gene16258-17901_t